MSSSTRWRGATALAVSCSLFLAACGSGAGRPAAAPSTATSATPGPNSAGPNSAGPNSAGPNSAGPNSSGLAPSTAAGGNAAAVAYPLTVQSAQGPVRIVSRPKAIVSLSPTATEMLFALGAGSQVIAVDDQSDYPANAPHSSLSGFKPSVEAITADKPDLVVISDDSSGLSAALNKVDIPVVVDPPAKTLDDAYSQLTQLGTATGHPDAAAQAVSSMRTQIGQLVGSVPHRAKPATYYYELDQTLYTATSSTFIGQLFKLLGAVNVADPADKAGSGGYPQLSAEYVVKSNPNLIFLADTKCCQQSPATVAARPGWSGMAAVKNGDVVNLDDDIASRWGPRVVDLLRTIVQALGRVPTG
jgi:iron complex transport system substrate-binding protein